MEEVRVGLVGGGYAASLHGAAYKLVHGLQPVLAAVADIDKERARRIAEQFGFGQVTDSIEHLIEDPSIDVIDICTPPHLHIPIAERALKAGKHVICEKPLTGYFGMPGDPEPVGTKVPKAQMAAEMDRSIRDFQSIVRRSGKHFMYAENYVYSPALQKTAEIIRARKSKVLFLKGEESLNGSSSSVAGQWNRTGGGVLIRAGIHPLTGVLWLKKVEGEARNEEIRVVAVHAETGHASASLSEYEHRHLRAYPEDVEDFAAVTLSFSDGTRALIIASDTALGGSRNYVEAYCNDGVLHSTLTPTDLLRTYFLDEDNMEEVYLSEMLSSRTGWNKAFVADEVIRGYTGELQDFMEAAAFGRPPQSGFDLSALTVRVIYAAYQSAEEGRRIYLEGEE